MKTPQRQRGGRLFIWAASGLVLLFGFLAAYERYNLYHVSPRQDANRELLQELKDAKLDQPDKPRAATGDWPQWRGPLRDGRSEETGLLKEWPREGPRVVWRAEGGDGYSAMAVAGGRAYTMLQTPDRKNEAVVCWDADTGEEQWRFIYPCQYRHMWGSGPRATPTVEGERVYTVGATGLLHCLDAATGKQLWRHDLLDEFQAENLPWGVSCSPLIEGELLFAMPGGRDGNSLAAFNKHNGELVWKGQDDPAGYSSPIAVTAAGVRQVLFFTGKRLVSVAPTDGRLYWSYPWETQDGVNTATPICLGDYVFISSGYRRGCALLKIQAEGDGLTVERVYENNFMCNHFSTCVLCQEHLYGFTDPGLLTCMEFRTGEVVWQQRGFDRGSLLVADGHLIVLGEYGKLALVEATPEGYREKAVFVIFPGRERCWSMPALAKGKLYLRDRKQVVCLDLKGGAP